MACKTKQEDNLISLETITNYLHYYRRFLLNPNHVKQVVEKFVDRVIKSDTIEVFFKVSVVTTGGGGAYPAVYTVKNFPYITLKYNDLRP